MTGEIDLTTVDLLSAALDALLDQRPDHLVVDLAGIGFCCSRGISQLVDAGRNATRQGVDYALAAMPAQAERLCSTLGLADKVPQRYPSTAAAVLAAQVQQVRRRISAHFESAQPEHLDRRATAADEVVSIEDRHLVRKAAAGDVRAHNALARRHNRGVYHEVSSQ